MYLNAHEQDEMYEKNQASFRCDGLAFYKKKNSMSKGFQHCKGNSLRINHFKN